MTLLPERAQELLGYAPDTPLETGLAEFVKWLQSYDPI